MKSKVFFFLFFCLVVSFLILPNDFALACVNNDDCRDKFVCVEGECVRGLELTYPQIPGAETPIHIRSGLPEYINYLFFFAILVSFFILFGVIVYNGIIYLTSTGNPAVLSDARRGIMAGFLGVVILLGAYIVFNTIDPQLVILEPAQIDLVSPIIPAGAYICTGDLQDHGISIEGILNNYTSGDKDRQVSAAREFREEVVGEPGGQINCYRVNATTVLYEPRRGLQAGERYSVFTVPEHNPRGATQQEKWPNTYGLIFHEKDDRSGMCHNAIWSMGVPDNDYRQVPNYSVELNFRARSVSLFRKTNIPSGSTGEITLYEGLAYNTIEVLGKDIEELARMTRTLTAPFASTLIIPSRLEQDDLLYNIRSFEISPPGDYFTVFLSKEDNQNRIVQCAVMDGRNPNLLAYPIGKCSDPGGDPTKVCRLRTSWWQIGRRAETEENMLEICLPCIERVFFVHGRLIK